MADRCRELLRWTERDDVREQLRHWVHEFEAEAEAIEKQQASGASRTGDR